MTFPKDGYELPCVGGPYDGEVRRFVMQREAVVNLVIYGEGESEVLGYYVPSEDLSTWNWVAK